MSLHKKWSKSVCGNFRGISLQSIVEKVFSRIILNRLIGAFVSNILSESQCSFRTNRGTVDMIFSARQLQKKCREQKLPLYHYFIDFLKVFDTVDRSIHWNILLKLGYPEKLMGLIRSLHNEMKARVHFSRAFTDETPVNNVVIQGEISTPTMFTVYFAVAFLFCFLWKSGWYLYLLFSIISVDCFAHTKVPSSLIKGAALSRWLWHWNSFRKWNETFYEPFCAWTWSFWFRNQSEKTVVRRDPVSVLHNMEPAIYIEGQKWNLVHSFIYLSSILAEGCSFDHEIFLCIEKTSWSFLYLKKHVWSQHSIWLEIKVIVIKTCVDVPLVWQWNMDAG